MSNKVRRHVYLSGRVQGVGCRYYILANARELSITGWVKNLVDGRVEAILEGDKDNIEKMVEVVKDGPTFGKVTDLKVIDEEYQEEFIDFRLRY